MRDYTKLDKEELAYEFASLENLKNYTSYLLKSAKEKLEEVLYDERVEYEKSQSYSCNEKIKSEKKKYEGAISFLNEELETSSKELEEVRKLLFKE